MSEGVQISINPDDINRQIVDAIAKSAIGAELQKVVDTQVKEIGKGYKNPLDSIVRDKIQNMVREVIEEQYSDQIREWIQEKVTEQFTQEMFNKLWDSFASNRW